MQQLLNDLLEQLTKISSFSQEEEKEGYCHASFSPERIEKDVTDFFEILKENTIASDGKEGNSEEIKSFSFLFLSSLCFYYGQGLHLCYPHKISVPKFNKNKSLTYDAVVSSEEMMLLEENLKFFSTKSLEITEHLLKKEIITEILLQVYQKECFRQFSTTYLPIKEGRVSQASHYWEILSFFSSKEEITQLNQLAPHKNKGQTSEKPWQHRLLAQLDPYPDFPEKEAMIVGSFWREVSAQYRLFIPHFSYKNHCNLALEELARLSFDLNCEEAIDGDVISALDGFRAGIKRMTVDKENGLPYIFFESIANLSFREVTHRQRALGVATPIFLSNSEVQSLFHVNHSYHLMEEQVKELKEKNEELKEMQEGNRKLIAQHAHNWKYFQNPGTIWDVRMQLLQRGGHEDKNMSQQLARAYFSSQILIKQLSELESSFIKDKERRRTDFIQSISPHYNSENSIEKLIEDVFHYLIHSCILVDYNEDHLIDPDDQEEDSFLDCDRKAELKESYQNFFQEQSSEKSYTNKNQDAFSYKTDVITWFSQEVYPVTVEISAKWHEFGVVYLERAYVHLLNAMFNLCFNSLNYGVKEKSGFLRLSFYEKNENNRDYLCFSVENPMDHDSAYFRSHGQGQSYLYNTAKSLNEGEGEFFRSREENAVYFAELLLDQTLFEPNGGVL